MGAVGADQGDLRQAPAFLLEHRHYVHVQLRLHGDGRQVADGVHRAADGDGYFDGVAESPFGQDVPGPQVLGDQLHDAAAGGGDHVEQPLTAGPDGRRTRQGHAQGLGHAVHGVGRGQPGADARPLDGAARPVGELVHAQLAGQYGAYALIYFLDVNVLPPAVPPELVAAGDHDRRNVQPRRGHELPRGRLIAAGQHQHPVQLGALDLHLHVVDQQVARGHDVAGFFAGGGDEVRRGYGVDLEGQSPRRPDGLLRQFGQLVQVLITDRQAGGGVDHGDLRLVEVRLVDAHGDPLGAADGPAGGARLEVAA